MAFVLTINMKSKADHMTQGTRLNFGTAFVLTLLAGDRRRQDLGC